MTDVASAINSLSQYHVDHVTQDHVAQDHIKQEVVPQDHLAPQDHLTQNGASSNGTESQPQQQEEEESPCINVVINNVVASFNVRCHINLRKVASEACNVEYKIANGMVSMKLRRPCITASIWSSGKITCTGATSEEDAKIAARKVSRILQKLGFRVKLANYRVVNVLGTCSLPFGINIRQFSEEHPRQASYEPELHPGVTFKLTDPKACLKIFSTGSLTITAPNVNNVQMAVGTIFPLVYPFKTPKPVKKVSKTRQLLDQHYGSRKRQRMQGRKEESDEELEEGGNFSDEFEYGSYSEEEDYASDQSFD